MFFAAPRENDGRVCRKRVLWAVALDVGRENASLERSAEKLALRNRET